MPSNWPVMEQRGPVVTESDILTFEERLSYRLPDDYRRFLLEINGGVLALSNISFGWSNVNLLLSLNDPDERHDLLTWTLRERSTARLPSSDLISVGFDDSGGGIMLVLAGEHQGEVWFENTANPRPVGSNPRVLWHDRRDVWKLADSFEQFMTLLKPLPAP